MHKMMIEVERFEFEVQNEIKIASNNIIETKETIEETLFGEVRNRPNVDSRLSIEV